MVSAEIAFDERVISHSRKLLPRRSSRARFHRCKISRVLSRAFTVIGRIRGYRLFFHPLARPISDVSSRERVRRVGSPKGGGNSARETRRAMFRGGCEGGRRGGSEAIGEEEEEEDRKGRKLCVEES